MGIRHRPFKRLTIIGLSVGILLVIGISAGAFMARERFLGTLEGITTAREAITHMVQLDGALIELRDALVSRADPTEVLASGAGVRREMASVCTLTADHMAQEQACAAVLSEIDAYVLRAQEAVTLSTSATVDHLAHVQSDLLPLRATLQSLRSREELLLRERTATSQSLRKTTSIILLSGLVSQVLLLATVITLVWRDVTGQESAR